MEGFSTAYDLVASEYGWSDKKIGNLPVARLRQIVANIQVRNYVRQRQERLDKSWMTRNITAYIAMGYWLAKDAENKPLAAAQELSLDDIEVDLLKMVKDNPPPVKEEEIQNGSYERFMLAFGQSAQRE